MHAASFSRIQYRFDTTRRARDRALKALQQLEALVTPVPLSAEPEKTPAECQGLPAPTPSPVVLSPQIGFVPSTRSTSSAERPSVPPHDPVPHSLRKASPQEIQRR
jgi:hypothetical protein